ncbi:MAG: 50S ribosomal protein L18 [bacterium]
MKGTNIKKEKRERRKKRIRSRVFGTATKPRLSVFKSNRYISVQVIDDANSKTLLASHSKDIKSGTLLEKSKAVGVDIAKKALAKKISEVVFDRGGFKYVGCVKEVADGARSGGLTF